MKILCSLSGVEFTCEHFPGSFYAREAFHPIFSISQKKLLSYTGKWAGGGLTPTDSYLLFLAILNSSDLVQFRVPAIRTEKTDAIIASYMEPLTKAVLKLNTVTNPEVVFPSYAITPETCSLENVKYWIGNWEEAYKEFKSGYVSAHDSAKLILRENALSRMIKSPHKKISEYAHQIADWAAIAGQFPHFVILNPLNKKNTTLSDYWKQIIIRCAKNEHIYQVPEKDLQELSDHCDEFIPIGNIYSNALFKLLREAKKKYSNFLGLGDIDLMKTTYQILSDKDTEESAQMVAIINSAPIEMPKPEQYPNKMAFLRAKLRYEMSKKLGSALPQPVEIPRELSNEQDDPTPGNESEIDDEFEGEDDE